MRDPIVLLFDAECMLCSRITRFVLKRDSHAVFRFAGLASETGRRLLDEHGLGAATSDTFVMIKDGRAFTESDAALRVFAQLPAGWKLPAALLALPRPLRNRVYRWIARNRYRWFGKADACLLPAADAKERFLP